MEKFNQFKSEILKRAKEVSACITQYQRAYKSENFDQLFQIIKDNFFYCCNNKIIDPDLIESVKEEAKKCGVYHNESATNAYILGSGNCTIEGYDNCTIEGYDNCTIRGFGNCTIRGYGNCTIEGYGNCTIRGFDNCTIKGFDNCTILGYDNSYLNVRSDMECKINDHAIMRYRDTNEVVVIGSNIKVKTI